MSYCRDKVAVVTGAGGTLCSCIAVDLAKKGAKVVLIGRTAAKLEKTRDAIVAAVSANGQDARCPSGLCARSVPLEVSANQRWGSVSLADKTTATVDKGITLACDAQIVAGVAKPNGVYREAKLPGVLTGDGRILVGEEPGTAVVLR